MKLYKLPNAPAGHRWLSHKTGLRDFEEIETPREGRQGMADFLNTNELEVMPKDGPEQDPAFVNEDNNEHDPIAEAERRAVAAQEAAKQDERNRAWDRHSIEDFILERATVADVESIFACLGNRFKELANGRSQSAGG